MNHNMKIDLLYYFNQNTPGNINWEFGEKRALDLPLKHLAFTVQCLLEQTSAEWVLFWDFSLGEPDYDLINEISKKPVDAWHCGLKLGMGGLPERLDYVNPTWMYNKDAAPTVEHTSFRLDLRACLVRTSVLKSVGGISTTYSGIEMTGLALGYNILKSGGIIRFHPELVKNDSHTQISIPAIDEWKFIRQYFPKKWQIWTILSGKSSYKEFKLWYKTRTVKTSIPKPHLHSSLPDDKDLTVPTVSVLVPTLDRYSYLLNELEQLSLQTVLPLEVLITDQTDKSNRIPIDFGNYKNLTVRYFPQDEKGQCVAWNKLLDEAKGEYVLFLGDDADGIRPEFIKQLLLSRDKFESDMVASNVIELGIKYTEPNQHYYLSDTFPITLIKRSVLVRSGFMDMFFNKNIRADHDLAMRCHLNGALMIFDPSATVYHHRAPAGGLRAHKARVVTNSMVKNSITKFLAPTSSEIYLAMKYFNRKQVKSYIRIKYLNQLFINGGAFKKVLRLCFFIIKFPSLSRQYHNNKKAAIAELLKNGVQIQR